MNDFFRRFAASCSRLMGSSWAFILALLLVVVWGLSGPYFHYSDTWELVINTSTTIVTFLMVFLVQSTQNRDAKAIQLKLDELIRCMQGARDGLVTLESMSDEELARLEKEFARLAGRKPGEVAPAAPQPR